MVSFIEKLSSLFSAPLRRRYSIFTGTNTWQEWRRQFRHLARSGALVSADTSVINDYENKFAQTSGTKHAFGFGAGRMALYAVLEALGIGPEDEVIIPAFTCVVVPNAILYRQARPVYVDIELRTFNIDVRKIEAAITPRTRALYAQHTFGVPCDVDALREIGRKHGLPVIEDAAHALGAKYKGSPVGSLTEIAFFSTDHSKVINTHLGGMATTNDSRLAARLAKIQSEAAALGRAQQLRLSLSFLVEFLLFAPRMYWIGRIIQAGLVRLGFLFYFLDELFISKPQNYPYPCRLAVSQARLGISQLNNLNENLAHRKKVAAWLEGQIGWTGMADDELNRYTWLRYSFLIRDRAKFESCFRKRFDLNVWFKSVVSGREMELKKVGYIEGSCPTAEFAVRHIVNFPTHLKIPLVVLQKEISLHIVEIRKEMIPKNIKV